jgi:hypothetical protein
VTLFGAFLVSSLQPSLEGKIVPELLSEKEMSRGFLTNKESHQKKIGATTAAAQS